MILNGPIPDSAKPYLTGVIITLCFAFLCIAIMNVAGCSKPVRFLFKEGDFVAPVVGQHFGQVIWAYQASDSIPRYQVRLANGSTVIFREFELRPVPTSASQ